MKNDKYSKVRDGSSHLLEIRCAKCDQFLFNYQKDGRGALIRCYLDRIVDSASSIEKALSCPTCGILIATPMIYKPENRAALRLVRGTIRKRLAD